MKKKTFDIRMAVIYRWIVYQSHMNRFCFVHGHKRTKFHLIIQASLFRSLCAGVHARLRCGIMTLWHHKV